jgi:glycosyltransferase involved in cell wall biosynthesis
MRILFVSPYFPPELGAPQTRIYEQAVRLKRKGHKVSVLTTFPNYPTGVVPKEWKGHLWWHGNDAGVDIYRFWTYATPNSGFYKRILSQLSFAFLACLAGMWLPATDVIVVESPPLFDGIAAVLLSVAKRAPFVFYVSDLWPETAVQLGVLRNRLLIGIAKRLELLFYRRAALVIAVTAGIRQSIAEEIGSARVVMLRNAVDTDFFMPASDRTTLKESLGLPHGRFLVLYAGTLGLAQQLSTVLECAGELQKRGNDVHFAFAGDGAEKERLQQKSVEMGLGNVSFLIPWPKAAMPGLLNSADCILVSLKDAPIFHAALPTKLFEAMSCGRPVVLAAAGEAEAVVRDAAAGYCARPGDTASIGEAILHAQQNRERGEEMGRRGREYMLANFSRERQVEELLALLCRVVPGAAVTSRETPAPRAKTEAAA